MENDEDYTMLDAIRDITETDRAFFNIVRFLDGNTRNHLVAAQLRNTNTAYQLLRQRPRQENIVMNIPLANLFDTSGNFMRNFMDPVPVMPNREQIRGATHIVTMPPPDTQCSICQEDITGVHTCLRHCNHRFHHACIGQWFEMNPRCPVCRHDIRESLQTNATDNGNDSSMYTDEE
jgi:hypothetical protein